MISPSTSEDWRTTCRAQREKPTEQRFWEKVDKSGECWLWTACVDKDGYGFFRHKGKNLKAHRVSFSLANKREPHGMLRHSCDTPACVNPAHLLEGTNSQNQQDSCLRNRSAVQTLLTADDVRRIREAHLFGAKPWDLEQAWGVSSGHMRSILKGERWQWLD